MTRSTRHRIISPSVAALCLAGLRLNLHVERKRSKQMVITEQIGAEMLDTRKSTGAMSGTNRHHPLTSMFLGGNDVR